MDYGVYERVKEYINRYDMISRGDVVVAGVSGGADSVCLFVVLCGLMGEMWRNFAGGMGFRFFWKKRR